MQQQQQQHRRKITIAKDKAKQSLNNEISTMETSYSGIVRWRTNERTKRKGEKKWSARARSERSSVEWHCSVDAHTALVFYDFNFEIFSCKKFYDKTLPARFFSFVLFRWTTSGISHGEILHRNRTNRQPRYHQHSWPVSHTQKANTKRRQKKEEAARKFIDRNMSGWFLLVEAMQWNLAKK